jgi:hypothetical protein
MTDNQEQAQTQTPSHIASDAGQEKKEEKEKQIDLISIVIKDENTALNVLVGFLGIAQRRGVFAINDWHNAFEKMASGEILKSVIKPE